MKNQTKKNKKKPWSKTKIRRITFTVMTCVFIVAAALLFDCNWQFLGKWANFMSQLCIGFATGSFVVALQETVREEEHKIDSKNRKKKSDNKQGDSNE